MWSMRTLLDTSDAIFFKKLNNDVVPMELSGPSTTVLLFGYPAMAAVGQRPSCSDKGGSARQWPVWVWPARAILRNFSCIVLCPPSSAFRYCSALPPAKIKWFYIFFRKYGIVLYGCMFCSELTLAARFFFHEIDDEQVFSNKAHY